MKIPTPRLLLRFLRFDDIKAFAELHADPDVMRYLDGVLPRADAENTASTKILEQLSFRNREELMFNNRPAIRFYD